MRQVSVYTLADVHACFRTHARTHACLHAVYQSQCRRTRMLSHARTLACMHARMPACCLPTSVYPIHIQPEQGTLTYIYNICTYTYICMYVCLYTYICMCVCVCVYVCVCVCVCVCVNYLQMRVHLYIRNKQIATL
jgi:hypothetical protein